jgi:hypothetical protein
VKSKLVLFLILILSFALNSLGIWWGLPSVERNRLYFGSDDEIKQSLAGVSPDSAAKSMTTERERLAGSRFNPIRSYHPDESNFIKAVSNMNPLKLDFNPRYLYYGVLYIYLFAFVLGVGFIVKFVRLTTDITFFFLNPDAIARFYLSGRFISVISGVLTVYLTYCIAKKLYGEKAGLLSALALSTTPIFVVNSHYISTDVTMSFFVCLAFLFSAMILDSPKWKWYILSGICAGLAAQAKYNAGLILLTVPAADLLRDWKGKKDLILCWFRKKVLVSYVCAAGIFLLLCPYIFLAPAEFKKALSGGIMRTGPSIAAFGSNIVFFAKVFYHGMGLPLFIISVLGVLYSVLKREKKDILLLLWIILNYLIIVSLSPVYDRHMRYTVIILPFLVIIASRFVLYVREKTGKISGYLLILFMFLPSLLFSSGYDRVFMGENIRTTAGKWIAQNVPAGNSIGLRRDPWQYETPPINRKKYCLFTTGRNPEETEKSLGSKKPDYFIISNAEYLENYRVWNELLCGKGYSLIKEFSNPPKVFGIPFNYKNPSDDYIYFYPKILIYRNSVLNGEQK